MACHRSPAPLRGQNNNRLSTKLTAGKTSRFSNVNLTESFSFILILKQSTFVLTHEEAKSCPRSMAGLRKAAMISRQVPLPVGLLFARQGGPSAWNPFQ